MTLCGSGTATSRLLLGSVQGSFSSRLHKDNKYIFFPFIFSRLKSINIRFFLMIIVDMPWSHDTCSYQTHPVDFEVLQKKRFKVPLPFSKSHLGGFEFSAVPLSKTESQKETHRKQTLGATVSTERTRLIAHTDLASQWVVFFDVPYLGFYAGRIILFCRIFPCDTWKQRLNWHLAGDIFWKLHFWIPRLNLDQCVTVSSLPPIPEMAVEELT